MTICDYCHTPIKHPRDGQRFCTTPGKNCRQKWHREHGLPGTVTGIRALKSGWSVNVRLPNHDGLHKGSAVRIETSVRTRPEAQGVTDGGKTDGGLPIESTGVAGE